MTNVTGTHASSARLQGESPTPGPLSPEAVGRIRRRLAQWAPADGGPPAQAVAALPCGTRALLLLAAAAQEADPAAGGAPTGPVLRAARTLGVPDEALEEAEQAGLVRGSAGRLRLSGQLAGSAVYLGASYACRREAHLLLAHVLDEDGERLGRLSHRALACDGPDAELAAALAGEARAEGGPAAVALERAAGLTADPRGRSALLVEAAEHARVSGRPQHAEALLARVRTLPADRVTRGRTCHVQGLVALGDGPVADARESLLLAAGLLAVRRPGEAFKARLAAGEAAWAMGDASAYREAVCPAGASEGTHTDDCCTAAASPGGMADYRSGMCAVLRGSANGFASGRAALRRVVAAAGAGAGAGEGAPCTEMARGDGPYGSAVSGWGAVEGDPEELPGTGAGEGAPCTEMARGDGPYGSAVSGWGAVEGTRRSCQGRAPGKGLRVPRSHRTAGGSAKPSLAGARWRDPQRNRSGWAPGRELCVPRSYRAAARSVSRPLAGAKRKTTRRGRP